ncbi:hypothetical protein C0J52_15921 [Blattella germanica]|nr:hypothetical protein C0J52_15921 [Blattella germanica]
MAAGSNESVDAKMLETVKVEKSEDAKDTSSRHGDDSSDDSFTDGESALSEEENMAVKVPLRSARRKSVMPQTVLKLNDGDFMDAEGPDQSPQNSITSINSISSLLKEKLARAYFQSIRFNNEERLVRVFNNEVKEIMYGHLGIHLGSDRAFRCLPQDIKDDMSVCMEWMHKTRLYMNYTEHRGVRCYHITWESLREDFYPTDCYDWSEGHGHWYGGGQTKMMAWPIEEGTVNLSPFVTGDIQEHEWGNVLKRYFINSNGVTLFVDPATPLYVSLNMNNSRKFCMQARYDDFAYVYRSKPLPQLNYSICTSNNMKSLHSFFSEKQLWDGLKEGDTEVINSLITEPVWQISSNSGNELTETAIYNYTEDVIALGFLRQGHVLLSEAWQPQVGDFDLDPVRFSTMDETINIIHRRGFRIVLTIQPFLSTESTNFAEAVKKRLLVSQRNTKQYIPALTSYKGVASAGMLDVTNNNTVPWLQAKLKTLVDKYHIDAFYLDMGTAYDIPHYYHFENQLINPDQYKTIFTESVLHEVGVVGVSSAVTRPKAPVFISLPPFPSTWKSMSQIIPTVLTYGVMGYPFIMPGAVGGDFEVPGSNPVRAMKNFTVAGNKTNGDGPNSARLHLPDKELYVRWLQLATFLPVIRYTHLPSKYGDENTGIPIIRPLWLLDPNDPACHIVVDEFSVGEELIVAPVLTAGTYEREVYLPAGVWKDGIDGSLRKGSRWLHSYRVPEDKVAHFIKMPADTRF